MPKARDYHLTEEELQIVEAAMKRDPRPGVRQRCTAIRLLHLGYKPEEVAHLQAVSIPTIYSWIKRWRKGGIEELVTKPRSGRPPKADEAYQQRVAEGVEKDPAELGYQFTVWTIDRLRWHLAKETGIELSEARFRALLKANGYRYRRPKYDLGHLQDKEAKARAEELLEELKKSPSRRFPACLCGRNHVEPRSAIASVLDEGWPTAAHCGYSAGKQAKTAHFWWLQLAERSDHLDNGGNEEQFAVCLLLGATAGERIPDRASGVGDGQCFVSSER
jgi:transposase